MESRPEWNSAASRTGTKAWVRWQSTVLNGHLVYRSVQMAYSIVPFHVAGPLPVCGFQTLISILLPFASGKFDLVKSPAKPPRTISLFVHLFTINFDACQIGCVDVSSTMIFDEAPVYALCVPRPVPLTVMV